MVQLVTVTSWKPPLDSVPIFSELQWLLRMQLLTTTLRQGRSSVLLRHNASSSLSKIHSLIETSWQESMSTPSLL